MNVESIQDQLNNNRRSVAFDSYDLAVRQLVDMLMEKMIDIAPEYQRHFKWNPERQSQLIESLMLGIPVPSLFMATNRDSSWEVIDGLQRLTTIINFIGTSEQIEEINSQGSKLRLTGLEKLTTMNGLIFEDLPKSVQMMFLTRPIRVTVLNDRSDFGVRFDLFERLNTGGITLHPQEIRNCIFLGPFNDFIKTCAENEDFRNVIKLPKDAERSGSLEELVLKFFAYYEDQDKFVHSVEGFLNNYMERKTSSFKNTKELRTIFNSTFKVLNSSLPDGIVRTPRKNTTPIVLFEAISVGTALAIAGKKSISPEKLKALLDSPKLKRLTTGATNSRKMLIERLSLVQKDCQQ
ncbi:DUF262 domain-containing protein [Zoogloea sp.]|uniref:DUF262 domain-containing protein n=1 Tax=Zoogloea sp. TaxID=49181 RepID=UPI0035ADDD15